MNNKELMVPGVLQFIKEMQANRYSPKYIDCINKGIEEFLFFITIINHINLLEVNKNDIIQYYIYLCQRQNKKTGKKLSKDTIIGKISNIRLLFSSLYKNNYIQKNPFSNLNLVLRKEKIWKRSPLTINDINYFLENINIKTKKGMRNRTIFELMYSSGLRVCEISNLRIADINIDCREIIVRGKFGTERLVPISKIATKFLKQYLIRNNLQDNSPVFPGKDKRNGITTNQISSIFRNYLIRFNLKKSGISAHSIRHSTATHLLDNGASIRYVQELLGHKSIKTTQRYTHIQSKKIEKIYSEYHPRNHKLYESINEDYITDVGKISKLLISMIL